MSDRVLTLFEDARGRIWIGTQEGVSFFDQGLWGAFGEQDGLPSPRVAAIAEVDGALWFGAEEGLSVHRPDRSPPRTRITNPPSGPVAAPSYFFELAGGDLETPPRRLRYSWRIDGGPWTAWSAEPLAKVTDLVNGSHLFEARCLDAELNADPTPAAAAFEVNTGLFDVELVDAAFGPLYASLYQFYASDPDFERRPAGQVSIRNRYDRPLRVKVSAFLADLMDFPTDAVATVPPGETVRVPLRIELSDRALDLEKTESRQLRLTLQYALAGERKESESTHAVTVIEKHGMIWEEPERIGLYVTHLDEAVERFARDTVRGFREDERGAIVYDNLLRAMELFDALAARGVRYVPDPENPYGGIIPGRPVLDTVRLPRETLRLRTGDCDDLAMLYAALLQNIGIDTAIVDLFDHVFVMFDTGLTARSVGQLARDPGLLHVDDARPGLGAGRGHHGREVVQRRLGVGGGDAREPAAHGDRDQGGLEEILAASPARAGAGHRRPAGGGGARALHRGPAPAGGGADEPADARAGAADRERPEGRRGAQRARDPAGPPRVSRPRGGALRARDRVAARIRRRVRQSRQRPVRAGEVPGRGAPLRGGARPLGAARSARGARAHLV